MNGRSVALENVSESCSHHFATLGIWPSLRLAQAGRLRDTSVMSSISTSVLADRPRAWLFWVGSLLVTLGVGLHLPMFWMGRSMGFRLAGMPMDPGMLWGMGAIVVGVGGAGAGLLPRRGAAPGAARLHVVGGARLRSAHWRLMAVLTLALVIDVMKPASLGFVVPGMLREYGVAKSVIAWLPLAALAGTVAGSIVWGWLADVFGRRASILLSSVMFVGTSICGAMPDFWWNVGMCFLMGAAAGGMLPVAYALLAEMTPPRHRSWSLVLVGGLGGVGGYLAASSLSGLLQPLFGWRVMWLLNLPTGLLLVALSGLIPESVTFLLQAGREAEARATVRAFGASLEPAAPAAPTAATDRRAGGGRGLTLVLSLAALTWGLVNFGLLLWTPAALAAKGYSAGETGRLLASSALIALPTVAVAAVSYSRWSTRGTLAASLGVTVLGLGGVLLLQLGRLASPVWPIALLIVGSNALPAVLLPYAAETSAARTRGRATGWVAACTKGGGLFAQALGVAASVPTLGVAASAIILPAVAATILVAALGPETRGRELSETGR